jgi:hypothetical protein
MSKALWPHDLITVHVFNNTIQKRMPKGFWTNDLITMYGTCK